MFGYRSRRRGIAGKTRGRRSVPTRRSTRNSQLSRFNKAQKEAIKKFNRKTTPSKPRVATPAKATSKPRVATPSKPRVATPSKKTKPTLSFLDYLKGLKAPAKPRTAKSGLAKLGKVVPKTTPSKRTKPTRSLGVVKLGKDFDGVAKKPRQQPTTKTPSKRTKPINERPTRSMRTLRGQSKRMENLYKRGLIELKPRRSNKSLSRNMLQRKIK